MDWKTTAAGQHGVLTSRQLRGLRVGDRTIRRLLDDGQLVRLWRGVYVTRPEPVEPEARWRQRLYAAVMGTRDSTGPGLYSAARRRSAARLWCLDGVDGWWVELATTSCSRGHCGITAVIRTTLDGPTTVIDGIPVTGAARTLLDLGAVVGAGPLERAVESALRQRIVTLPDLSALLAASPGAKGAGTLRSVLALRPPGVPPTESDAETCFLQLARRSGLPEPIRQFRVPLPGPEVRVDFSWPARTLLVEIDGAATHATPGALLHDLRRQNRLMGWLLLRFTWTDVVHDPDSVARTLRQAWALQVAAGGRRG